ncbi:putative DNA-binding domain-containing protein [Glaciecola sp. 1036]|uniref:HvfC/BufC family peptide modification chaperone n=1 Tax=Alteromonadaceae TaxID=72275 RepID=UPI003D066F30
MDYQQLLINSIFNQQGGNSSALEIYQNNYVENAINALSISFPTLLGIIGEPDFRKIAFRYAKQFPKSSFDWAEFGTSLSEFLQQEEMFENLPYLSEIADFDWRRLWIERAPDETFSADSFALLQQYPPSELRFRPAAGLQKVEYFFPIDTFYDFCQLDDQNSEQKQTLLLSLKKAINDAIKQPHLRSFVLWRHQAKAQFEVHSPLYCNAFDKLLDDASVEEVLATLEKSPEQMHHWLQSVIAKRQVVAIEKRSTSADE